MRGLLDTFDTGDIVLGDAYFGGYLVLAELQSRGVDTVSEQYGARKRVSDFRKGKKLGAKDHLITYSKLKKKPDWMTLEAYENAPETVTVRELKVSKKTSSTTLISPNDAPKPALKSLYKERWHVELDLRNIKTTLGMETFSCKSPEMAEKETWVYLLAYNLIRLLIVQSTKLTDRLPRNISFKHSVQIWQAFRHTHKAT